MPLATVVILHCADFITSQGIQDPVIGEATRGSYLIKYLQAMIKSCHEGFMHHFSCGFFLGCKPLGVGVCREPMIGRKDKEEGDTGCGGKGSTSFVSCTTTLLSPKGREHVCLISFSPAFCIIPGTRPGISREVLNDGN